MKDLADYIWFAFGVIICAAFLSITGQLGCSELEKQRLAENREIIKHNREIRKLETERLRRLNDQWKTPQKHHEIRIRSER